MARIDPGECRCRALSHEAFFPGNFEATNCSESCRTTLVVLCLIFQMMSYSPIEKHLNIQM